MSTLLNITSLSAGYGGQAVLDKLDLSLACGERVALIGPNGCGKSTLLKTIVDETPESNGKVVFDGEDITALPTDAIIHRGIGYLRQSRNIFPSLTVEGNLDLASLDGNRGIMRDAMDVLQCFPMLQGREHVRAGLLSGGEKQALAVAMVLLQHVKLLMLDEPLAGLSPNAAKALLEGIFRIWEKDRFAMVIVEHRLKLIQPFVERVIIMQKGAICLDSDDASLLTDQPRLDTHFIT